MNVHGKVPLTWKCSNFKNFRTLRPKRRNHLRLPICPNSGHSWLLHENFANRRHNTGKFLTSHHSSGQLRTLSPSFLNDISLALFSRLYQTYLINYQRERSLHYPRPILHRWNKALSRPRMPHHLWRTSKIQPLLLKKWSKVNFLISWRPIPNQRFWHLRRIGVHHELS